MNDYKKFSFDESDNSISSSGKKQSGKNSPKKKSDANASSKNSMSKSKSDTTIKKIQTTDSKRSNGKSDFRPNYVRMVFGILMGFSVMAVPIVLWALGYIFYSRAPLGDGGRWVEIILMVVLYILAAVFLFYAYGWMHRSFIAYSEHLNTFVRIFGKIAGGIGYIFRPFVLMAYGANKKWLFTLTVGVPCLVLGTVFLLNYLDILAFDAVLDFGNVTMTLKEFTLPLTIVCYLNAALSLFTKRCNKCGCMMTEIEAAIMGEQWKNSGGYFDRSMPSSSLVIGKFYICDNCNNVKKGVGFDVQTR